MLRRPAEQASSSRPGLTAELNHRSCIITFKLHIVAMSPPRLCHTTRRLLADGKPDPTNFAIVRPPWARLSSCRRAHFYLQSEAYAAPLVGTELAGRPLVVDGDTIEIAGQRIRLEGIDAPESAQTCQTEGGATTACGRVATRALAQITDNQIIACESVGTDKYGRMLGICFLDGEDINRYMVESGNAWAFVKYSQRYIVEEAKARAAKIGIWQGAAQPAWEFRPAGKSRRAGLQRAARSREIFPRMAASITCPGKFGMRTSRLILAAASAGSARKPKQSAPAGVRRPKIESPEWLDRSVNMP